MELTMRRQIRVGGRHKGVSLIELLIGMTVLVIGVLASAGLIMIAIGANGRSRQQSNSIAMAQMVTEKISSIPANASATLTITDCNNVNSNISTAPGGSVLLPSGEISFTVAAPPNYSMLYTTCGPAGRRMTYDVRWNIQSPSPYTKIITVCAKLRNAGNDLKYFSLPVTIRTVTGQGS